MPRVIRPLSGTTGVDVSSAALLQRALEVPGLHELGLIVRSYPADQMVGPGWDYDTPSWQARCNPVGIEVQP